MKLKAFLCAAIAMACLAGTLLQAQTAAPQDTVVTSHPELQQLLQQIQGRIQEGKRAEADFTNELSTFDMLIAANKTSDTNEAAKLIYMKGMLYVEVIKDYEKAAAIMSTVATNYPNTEFGDSANKLVAQMATMAAAKKMQDKLAIGTKFPDFAVTNLNGLPLSVHKFKGKVVLLDFWATWCPPCRAELPTVIDLYKKYHADGFQIIGINLDSERDQLTAFLQDKPDMNWPQYSDGYGWTNVLVLKYGVTAIPHTILIGPNGRIIGNNVHGEGLENAVAEAMTMLMK